MGLYIKKVIFASFILLAAVTTANAQRGLAVYPLQNKLGYRSNADDKRFWDLKANFRLGGPLFVNLNIEFSRCRRYNFQNHQQVRLYTGYGVTVDGFVPGLIFPVGIEILPLKDYPQLFLLAEANPRITLIGAQVFNSTLIGNVGVAYHFFKK